MKTALDAAAALEGTALDVSQGLDLSTGGKNIFKIAASTDMSTLTFKTNATVGENTFKMGASQKVLVVAGDFMKAGTFDIYSVISDADGSANATVDLIGTVTTTDAALAQADFIGA